MSTHAAAVSVVIPCYRCAELAERAIASAANQTLPPREIIVIDDGSADGTLRRLEALRQRWPMLRVVALPNNRGPGAARNAGWDAATQPWVAFLDADDAWHPRKLEIQWRWMRSHPKVALTGTGYTLAEPWSAEEERTEPTSVRNWHQLLSNRFVTSSVMVRHDVGVRFEPTKRHSEDNLLWLTILLHGSLGYRFPQPLVRFYKPLYGAGGLSRELWKMQLGQLDTFRRVRNTGLIGPATYAGVSAFALLKFARRALRTLSYRVRV